MVRANEVGNKKNPNRNSAYSVNDSAFSSNYWIKLITSRFNGFVSSHRNLH